LKEKRIVAGGGAIEVELAKRLRKELSVKGREQLAVEQFADALESIPKSLLKRGN
jgi:chaperonin GroEL (HSP60 family)